LCDNSVRKLERFWHFLGFSQAPPQAVPMLPIAGSAPRALRADSAFLLGWAGFPQVQGTSQTKEQVMGGRVAEFVGAALLAGLAVIGASARCSGQQAERNQPLLEVQQKLPDSLAPGRAAAIEIHIHNRGAAAENVSATAVLPAGCELQAAEPGPERSTGSLRWMLGAMEAGGERILRLRLATTSGAWSQNELRSVVKVSYQTSIQNTAVAVVKQPALALRVSGPGATAVGEPASVNIAVSNTGGAAAEEVVLQTVLPAGLAHPGGNDLETDVGTLQPGETKQITLAVTPTQAGEFRHRIRALVRGAPAAEQEARLLARDWKVAVTANGPRLLYPDWTGSFEVVVKNEDARPAYQVSVSVGLPTGLVVARSSDNGVYDTKDRTLRWHLSELKPNETRTLVWSGVARAVGDQVCEVRVSSGSRGGKAITWRTAVPEAPATPAARIKTEAAVPSGPALVPPSLDRAVVAVTWRPAGAVPSAPVVPFESREPAAQPAPPGQLAVGWR
jgi:uncharacterized repeat protein (TIGR01451 family)